MRRKLYIGKKEFQDGMYEKNDSPNNGKTLNRQTLYLLIVTK